MFDIISILKGHYKKWRHKDTMIGSTRSFVEVKLNNKKVGVNEIKIPLNESYIRFEESNSESSYVSILDNTVADKEFAKLVTCFHATKISDGNKLETFIYDEYIGEKYENIDFDDAIEIIKNNPNSMIVFRKVKIKKETLNDYSSYKHNRSKTLHLDYLVLYENVIYINELKDGSSLDTKKSDSEITEMKMVKEVFENVTKLICHASIVLWTCKDLKNSSIKSMEAIDHIITGEEFSTLLNVDHATIQQKRKLSNKKNSEVVANKLNKIVKKYNEQEREK